MSSQNESRLSLRKRYERATIPIGKALAKLRITPTAMTVLSIIIAISSLYYFYNRDLLGALIMIIVSGVCDILDGAIARATNEASSFGTLLDNTADRIVEGILMIGFVMGGYVEDWIALLTLLAMFLPSYVRARGEAELAVNARGVGIFERKEKLGTLFGGMIIECLNPGYMIKLQYKDVSLSLSVLSVACIIVTIGSVVSMIQRILFFKRHQTEIS